MREDLHSRITVNKDRLMITKGHGKGSSPSFFKSEAVGVALLQCLLILEQHNVPTCD